MDTRVSVMYWSSLKYIFYWIVKITKQNKKYYFWKKILKYFTTLCIGHKVEKYNKIQCQ